MNFAKAQHDTTSIEAFIIDEKVNAFNEFTSKVDLSVRQTLKYPGVFFDPARLAMTKVGVINDNDQANGLSIRGNSPDALQWRLEGVEILNANHLSNAANFNNQAAGASGGVNMLSTQLLGTSALIMGGFTAEYSNILSGVMDMRLRNGETDRNHLVGQIGLVGIDVAASGPITKNKRLTYATNYRYSTVGLLSKLGVDFGNEKTAFQDLGATFTYTAKKNWGAKMFFIGGKSYNNATGDSISNPLTKDFVLQDKRFEQSNAIIGLTANGKVFQQDEWKITFAHSIVSPQSALIENIQNMNQTLRRSEEDSIHLKQLSAIHLNYKNKIINNLEFRIGIKLNYRTTDLSTIYIDELKGQKTNTNSKNNLFQYGSYFDLAWQATSKLKVYGGLILERNNIHYESTTYNKSGILTNNYAADFGTDLIGLPSLAVQYLFNRKSSVTLSYTQSNQIKNSKPIEFITIGAPSTQYNLQFQKQFEKATLRTEAFYQKIKHALPTYQILENTESNQIIKGISISLSSLKVENFYYDFNATLYNAKAQNFSRTIINNQIFEQQFAWMNSPNNGKFASNLTIGKEWQRENKTFGVNGHIFYNGGQRKNDWTTILQNPNNPSNEYYNQKFPNYFRTDLRVYRTKKRQRSVNTLSLDIQNVTNQKTQIAEIYNAELNTLIPRFQTSLVPILNFRMEY